jgi:hypothetical protein
MAQGSEHRAQGSERRACRIDSPPWRGKGWVLSKQEAQGAELRAV